MNWKQYFTTSIGKKIIVGGTGLFLVTFLLVHVYANSLIFLGDQGKQYLDIAHFLGTNIIIRIVEVGLFLFFILHIVQGLMLWYQNSKRRPVKYAMKTGKTSPWYSRSMGLLGTLILMFLVIHLYDFWAPNRYSMYFGSGELNLYQRMIERFTNPIIVVVYVLGCISLAWHLVHGFYSAFQTFGLTTHKYRAVIKGIGYAFAVIVPFIFAMMPISMYFGWVS
jgi:succinate dehydrogenase / fumarate reductase, cytochrome b subunit